MLFLLSLVKVVVVVELSTSLPCFVVCGNDVGGDNTATSSSVDNKIDAVATDDVTAPPVAVIVGSTWAFDLESTDEFSSRGFGTITVMALVRVVAVVFPSSASGLWMAPLSKYRLVLLLSVVAPFLVRTPPTSQTHPQPQPGMRNENSPFHPNLRSKSLPNPHHYPASSYGLSYPPLLLRPGELVSWSLLLLLFSAYIHRRL